MTTILAGVRSSLPNWAQPPAPEVSGAKLPRDPRISAWDGAQGPACLPWQPPDSSGQPTRLPVLGTCKDSWPSPARPLPTPAHAAGPHALVREGGTTTRMLRVGARATVGPTQWLPRLGALRDPREGQQTVFNVQRERDRESCGRQPWCGPRISSVPECCVVLGKSFHGPG